MKKTKTFKPYEAPSVCTLKTTGPGTYIIYKEGRPVYVGFSASDVKKTMYRHFQSWNDPTQRRVTYKQLANITCRVIFTTAQRAAQLEEYLILKLKPRDNEQKLNLYTQSQLNKIEQEYFQAIEAPF